MLHRIAGSTAALFAVAFFSYATDAHAQTPQVFSGTGVDGVTSAIASFKAAIGGADNGSVTGSQPTGFRQVTWDDVPDSLAAPYTFLDGFDFYNKQSPRGLIVVATPVLEGQEPNALEVSANASNPTSTPALFGNINPALPSYFAAFSPQRIFRVFPLYREPVVFISFKVPGTSTSATVSGFGAVFTDVNLTGSTHMSFYDLNNGSLGTFTVPAASGHQMVSFCGVVFPGARISSVSMKVGTASVSNSVLEDATHDIVALDDFVYAEPQPFPPPPLTVTTPTAQTDFTATGPFLTLSGSVLRADRVTWTSDRGGSGRWEELGPTWSFNDIPIAAGPNVITLTATSFWDNVSAQKVLHVNGGAFAYSFAEGSTGSFFDTDLSIMNPNGAAAPVTMTFLREDGGRIVTTDTIAPMSRKRIPVAAIPGLEATAFSTVVTSDARLPLVVERTMFWDHRAYGGKGAAAVDTPSETWVFAEGVENSFFTTFVLLENPGSEPANATLTFELAFGEPSVIQQVSLPPLSRVTVDTGGIPALVGRSFGVSIQATHPIVAERATYFESTPIQLWAGGHGGPGAIAPSLSWYFAEGATGPFRQTFVMLTNPNDLPAQAFLEFAVSPFTYHFSNGLSLTLTEFFVQYTLPPHSRLTIPLDTVSSSQLGSPLVFPLANTDFAMLIGSDRPIVAERAMYWLGAPGPWADGTSSFGTKTTGVRWGYAEGRVGAPLNFHTYLRLFNPSQDVKTANVNVTFIKDDGSTIVKNYTVPPFVWGYPPPPQPFVNIDVNRIPGLDGHSFGVLIESTNGVEITTERSMYWDSNGNFWAAGITTAGTRLP
jgi:hypothetical protein